MVFKYKGVDSLRVTTSLDECDFYRNLNKKEFFSCKQRSGDFKGKVTAYAKIFIVKNPSFVISEKSRNRVLDQKCRNVHSYLRGQFLMASDDIDDINVDGLLVCSYNPYYAGYFYECDSKKEITREIVNNYLYAILKGSNVYLTNNLAAKINFIS